MSAIVFDFETSKAQLMRTQELIIDAVDKCGISRVSDEKLPEVEMLGNASGPYFKYRLRIPVEVSLDEAQLSRLSESVPSGTSVRLE